MPVHHLGLAQCFYDGIADLAGFFHFVYMGRYLGFRKFTCGFSKHVLFFGKGEINHG
jgi:hypothetical protein